MFANRKEAGEMLYKELINYKNNENAVIVSIPRGGVSIGYPLSEKLKLPLELVLSKKIGHPLNKEFAIGAVTLESVILDPEVASEVSEFYIENEVDSLRDILRLRQDWYYGFREPMNLKDKIVIIVDDGVATGNTLISSIQLIQKQQPKEIVIALPVAPKSTLDKIKKITMVNNIICLDTPRSFQAVGQFYEDFGQVEDEEVIELMKKANDFHLKHSKTHV